MELREKVIKGLEKLREYVDSEVHPILSPDNWGIYSELRDLIDETENDALALLKAQEPVEPVVDKNTSTGECEDPWGRLFFCGACGKRINEKYDPDEDDKYCKHCGQAVKWE